MSPLLLQRSVAMLLLLLIKAWWISDRAKIIQQKLHSLFYWQWNGSVIWDPSLKSSWGEPKFCDIGNYILRLYWKIAKRESMAETQEFRSITQTTCFMQVGPSASNLQQEFASQVSHLLGPWGWQCHEWSTRKSVVYDTFLKIAPVVICIDALMR